MLAGQGSGPRGGQTQLQTSTPRASTTIAAPQAVLRLRGAPREEIQGNGEGSERRTIQWAEDVVDNEGMGKKKSKGIVLSRLAIAIFSLLSPVDWKYIF